jgi:hypothetical protein
MEVNDSKLIMLIQEIEKVRRRKVVNYSDANSNINYLDPFNNLDKIKIPNNHLVLGRRGSGKTTLLLSTIKQSENFNFFLPIDCQLFRDWSESKIKLHISKLILEKLKNHFESSKAFNDEKEKSKGFVNSIRYWIKNKGKVSNMDEYNYFMGALKRTEYLINVISDLPDEPIYININHSNISSEVEKKISTYEIKSTNKIAANGRIPFNILNLNGNIELALNASKTYNKDKTETKETKQNLEYSKKIVKTEKINEQILLFADLFNEYNRLTSEKAVLYLDDFYLINMEIQPDIIQYFHDIYKNSKNDCFCFKICSIPNRTKINKEGKVDFSFKDDFSPIRLDKELYDFENLVDFLLKITSNLNPNIEINTHDIRSLFSNEDVLKFTVVSTGGVPRDFLVILSEIIKIAKSENSDKIRKEHLYSAISDLRQDKEQNIEVECDIPVEKIRQAIEFIQKEIIEGLRTNVILYPLALSKSHERVLKNLVNLRYLHVINESTSSEKIKKENFVSYLIDMTFYATGKRLKQNFDFREFWIQDAGHRHIHLRNAPIWHFSDEFINKN